MKYSKEELDILKTKGRKALLAYRKQKRLPLIPSPKRIESKKFKEKYKKVLDSD